MNKKLILLILLLPLVLMFCLYTTTSSVGIEIKAPVSSIEITGDNIVYLDFDDGEKYFVNYTVYPITAVNKQVIFTTEKVGEQKLAELDFVDGYIIPKTTGVAKVSLSTVDGGFKDSFIVQVDSIKVQKIVCHTEKTQLMVGETTTITTAFTPENATNRLLNFVSSDISVAQVNDKGIIRGVGRGSAVITVTSEQNPNAKDTIIVDVFNRDIMDFAKTEIYTWQNSGSLNISIDTDENFELDYETTDINGNTIANPFIVAQTGFENVTNNQVLFNYAFENDFIGSVLVKITITTDNPIRQPFSKTIAIHRVDQILATFDNDEVISCVAGAPFALHNKITMYPEDADVHFEVYLSNDNVRIEEVTSKIRLTAVLPGVTTLTLNVVSNTLPYQTITLEKEIVVLPTNLNISNQAETYGIEDIWTVGKFEADGSASTSKLELSFGKTTYGTNFMENFSFTTDSDKVVVENNGQIVVLDENFSGIVNISGKFGYETVSMSTPTFAIRCVGKGFNIRNFYDLYTATKQNKVVVLQGSIINDFGKDKVGNDVYSESSVEKISSTYDTTHYKNLGKIDDAKVKVLLSFKADVYGNGYQINAHNVAYGLDSAGQLKENALFKGPLNFVSMSESSSSLVSVKAQDNISFAVYENVTLSNVELSSCTIQADSAGNYDLTDLTYVGTTVEVLGDNVNIEYSRINNGRTVLRVFGDIKDSQKVINLNIKNSVLSSAREFIIRMGSNAFVDGTKENPSPYIDEKNQTFPAQVKYQTMSPEQKEEYENAYIKTFVCLKNSILKDAGLFCVGIDTHFSGGALADGKGLAGGLVDSWYDLAKTSYGAKLTFEGDVRMYDWKEVDKVDSSTLIEIIGSTAYADLKFDVRELIEGIANNESKPHLSTIVHNQNGKKYVHGGIAFFGGGKNYSVFETKDYTFKVLNGYEVKFSDINKIELQVAAGDESFYFLLNDSTTQGFLPDDQTTILEGANAYAPIYKKD